MHHGKVVGGVEVNRAEATFLERLRAGEDAAFEELVHRYAGPMLTAIRRLLGTADEAHDALQDAFLSVFRGIGQFRGEASLSTWLHRIALNSALARLRKRSRTRETPVEELLPQYQPDGHRTAPDPAWREVAEEETLEVRELVRKCVAQLPENHRTILILRDFEGMDTAEVAAMLDITASAAKVRLHRARQALRTLLAPHFAAGPTETLVC
jgi:RNA polymerase sigma-70 factor (ECF subfamily)